MDKAPARVEQRGAGLEAGVRAGHRGVSEETGRDGPSPAGGHRAHPWSARGWLARRWALPVLRGLDGLQPLSASHLAG